MLSSAGWKMRWSNDCTVLSLLKPTHEMMRPTCMSVGGVWYALIGSWGVARLQYIEDELAKKKGPSDKPEEVSQ